MRILITGGAGFIGSNYINYILHQDADDQIVCMDALTYAGNLDNLTRVRNHPGFTFIKGNISDRERVYTVFKEYCPEAVVNFAAESHVDRSIEFPDVFLQTNVVGTGVLLDASCQFGVKRFHQVSTDEVYGDLPLDCPDLWLTEKSPLNASSPYSASKASADLLVLSYYRTYRVNATISRCSNNYGPYQYPEKLIPLMVRNILKGIELPIYGKGDNIRDWLYVGDHCSAIDLILRKGAAGEVYNVGGHNEKRNIDVVNMIIEQLGKGKSLLKFIPDRPGHDRRYAIDPTKITEELGWSPKTCFEHGLKQTIDWYVNNRDWWDTVNKTGRQSPQ
ncbi:MAG: dTDP-glucose 4,6-dehydratase [Oscillospiraceae bacterium]|jgi:dTDP-glucose 4,6-dehydratase|nr:dTDP-glucose 4,6-dehydratase [Oscillospiraceae bacterium]